MFFKNYLKDIGLMAWDGKPKYYKKNSFSGSSFEQPPTWTTMAQNENVAVVTLLPNSLEFQDVQTDFIQSTGTTYTIVKVLYFDRNMYHSELFSFIKWIYGGANI